MVAMWMIEQERAALYGGQYAWVITRDRDYELHVIAADTEDQTCHVGTAGPSDATDEALTLARTQGVAFRLVDEGDIDDCDDNGVPADHPDYGVVYEGLLWMAGDAEGGIEFMPLHDFGAPNCACIGIQFRDAEGVWRDA